MPEAGELCALADRIDPDRARVLRQRLVGKADPASYEHAAALLLATAYPALSPLLEADPRRVPRPRALEPDELAELERHLGATDAPDEFRRELRRIARKERLRIALREVLPPGLGGARVEQTARELSDLADMTIRAALAEAARRAFERYGELRDASGAEGKLVVLGMGKLGGRELNAGSDVDLVCFYDSDEAVARRPDGRVTPAHELWTRVVQRMTSHLEDVTEDGFVWRVDHRLRPEGARGPLVSSLVAAERYYETFGRLWERAALLRARPVAGDRELGEAVLQALAPFVWIRRVDPSIATSMYELVHRARAELSPAPERDLKLGPGGIREAEFFVQTLQLVWGGREPRLRVRSTIAAAARLRAAGYLTEREAHDLVAAYVALRRAEHAVQFATGVQTHSLPSDAAALARLARVLGHADAGALASDLEAHGGRVSELLASLLPEGQAPTTRWSDALKALDRDELEALERELRAAAMPGIDEENGEALARDLFETARLHPDSLLGSRTRERHRALVDGALDALADAADPMQAARYLRGFASRLRPAAVYTRFFADDPAAITRLITVLGGSAFVGEAVATRPELGDLLLFEHVVPTPEHARAEALAALRAPLDAGEELLEQQAAGLRRAKQHVTTQVALADLAGEIGTRQATLILSALADASLEAAAHFALDLDADEPVKGLAVLAMGKLGGREIGYGSDLDVIFLYRDEGEDPVARHSRAARRIIQLIGMPHVEGPGYELDTRLRPSGNQGLLVVSLDAFARYHQVDDCGAPRARAERAATWERLALLRARFAAGDAELGRAAIAIAHRAAYDRGGELNALAPDVHRLRLRMESELARERPGRYDIKFGRGGLLDIELSVQLLQLVHGSDARLRTTETRIAIRRLEQVGAIDDDTARALREGYAFLRRLEQRLRVLHGDSSHLIEEHAAGLVPLARRMGIRDVPGRAAAAALIEQYRAVTERVRAAYQTIVTSSGP